MGKRATGHRQGYTILTDTQLDGLHEAGASRNEALAYAMLARFHGDGGMEAACHVNAEAASKVLGMDASGFSKCLAALTRKTFAVGGGVRVPVLVRLGGGHRGHVTTYLDNLYAYSLAVGKGGTFQPAITPTKQVKHGDQSGEKAGKNGSESRAKQTTKQGNVDHPQEEISIRPPRGSVIDRTEPRAGGRPQDADEAATDGDHTAEVSRRALELIRGGLDPREALRLIGGEG